MSLFDFFRTAPPASSPSSSPSSSPFSPDHQTMSTDQKEQKTSAERKTETANESGRDLNDSIDSKNSGAAEMNVESANPLMVYKRYADLKRVATRFNSGNKEHFEAAGTLFAL